MTAPSSQPTSPSNGKGNTVDLKIVLLGSQGVGKTSLVHSFMSKSFSNHAPTVGALFSLYKHEGLNIGIWDTAGSDRYEAISSFYCRGAGAALLVYDITDASSFHGLKKYHEKLLTSTSGCILSVVGCRLDLVNENPDVRAVNPRIAKTYAESIGASFTETSSKEAIKVNEVFEDIIDRFQLQNPQFKQGSGDLGNYQVDEHQTIRIEPLHEDSKKCNC
eukprot:TRINITY_DN7332_c0_g1_i1.p1 TRINITY_DN7332_c0_g1~~TRINITY_DN7332_c0_g1_i1.p1  ORF type:complete len:219 (+),score=47.21 TRINITY_DN7332_c0_g1_i1:104-760(+)